MTSNPDSQTTPPTPEFKAVVDAVIAAGHTCESVLGRLDARIAATLPGAGRDNLTAFRAQLVAQLVEKIDNARR
jgi:hypothetical protein